MKRLFRELFQIGLEATRPEQILPPYLPMPPKGRTIVVGAGKGAAQLAAALEKLWPEPLEGVVVTRYGFGAKTKHIEILEASHPIPDQAGIIAARRLQQVVSELNEDDLVIALMCGGGSALLPAPPEGITLEDEITLTQTLLASGLPIAEMNSIRAVFSTIKAGRLAAQAAPARLCSLVVSDVVGDHLELIASGPTMPATHHADTALRAITEHHISLPAAMQDFLDQKAWHFPNPKDRVFQHHEQHLIASNRQSLHAMAEHARTQGYQVTILSDQLEGEAQKVARDHGMLIRALQASGQKNLLVLSGGELTVTHDGTGSTSSKGGPNSEYILALAREIAGLEDVAVFAADSDGIDGIGDHAGAYADGTSWQKISDCGIDPAQCLNSHTSYNALNSISGLLKTGATGTNVNDIRIFWI